MAEQTSVDGGDTLPASEHVEVVGDVSSKHGIINGWLRVVYVVMFVWALYYGFTYWGGLGPGLDY